MVDRIFASPSLVAPTERLYEVVPVGEARRLTPAEQTYISRFVTGPESLIQKALDHGMNPRTLKVEFTFENGHRGGLLFSRK